MNSLPLISVLVLVFSMIILGEHIKLKKEVRKLQKSTKYLKKIINKMKGNN